MKEFNRILAIEMLEKAKEIYNDIMINYSNVLPKNITDAAERTIYQDIPNHINNLIDILNLSEKKQTFHKIQSIDEAIIFLQNNELDDSIKYALLNKDLSGYSLLRDENLSLKDILNNISFMIDNNIQYLSIQRATGKLAKGEF
ncbi:hypothetical protein EG347_11620 [Chryseobacterium sp. G0186]|uniref:hypothetical protein n=1 Tax=Chryseobacterium sp. G0186 TaxID=2487064 RepID=UPI000F4DAB5E|nr:hypothetical protein [Chryseobacterium sp. G0186]AZA78115.1 hypothetical protein EG347_11620 [Chryseobacterium sp. G0186]